MPRRRATETFVCPICGADVPVGSPGCRQCGSTAETGWSADTEYDGLDLPSGDEDASDADPRRRIPHWVLVVIILATAATLLVSMW